jgi:ferredoxin
MPTVTFQYNGQVQKIEAQPGQTLLQISLDHQIPMEHACGGNGFCTTCLCTVKDGAANLGPKTDRETGMGIEGNDRLGCQATVQGDVTVEITG